ncbi:MAG: histidine phosphatase family protein [Anaerolineae bacterium]|nr:histidine phosphatase family protein [Candidatus Roseilinea sp.]MDW8448518.1 histidine phosphatase family protein [Anaerolineae bacterium]
MSGVPRSVWLVRHGQADWNVARRYMSFTDRPLAAFGERQAQALARFFAARKVDLIVHSGLIRTEATAQAIKGARNVPVYCDERWREASHGAWEGLTYCEVTQRYPEDAARRFADPVNHPPLHGESLAQLAQRVRQAWDDLGARFPGRRVVAVTHSGPIQVLLCLLMGTPLAEHWRWRIDLGSVTGLDCYPTTTILRMVNHALPLPTPPTPHSPLPTYDAEPGGE